jgi:nitroreductase
MLNEISIRRSVRKFLDKEVEREKILELIKAGMQAPSANNQQPWEFIIVKNKEILNKLSEMKSGSYPLKLANFGIIVLGNKKRIISPDYLQQDLSACVQNILLEAVNQNLGAVWIGVAPIESRISFVKDILSLEEYLLPFAIIACGYAEEGANYFIDRFEESRIIKEV